jgi:hypothetical protein
MGRAQRQPRLHDERRAAVEVGGRALPPEHGGQQGGALPRRGEHPREGDGDGDDADAAPMAMLVATKRPGDT